MKNCSIELYNANACTKRIRLRGWKFLVLFSENIHFAVALTYKKSYQDILIVFSAHWTTNRKKSSICQLSTRPCQIFFNLLNRPGNLHHISGFFLHCSPSKLHCSQPIGIENVFLDNQKIIKILHIFCSLFTPAFNHLTDFNYFIFTQLTLWIS